MPERFNRRPGRAIHGQRDHLFIRDRAERADSQEGRLGPRGDGSASGADREGESAGQRDRQHAATGTGDRQAVDKDRDFASGTKPGPMFGFPHAVKDLCDAAGFPTTNGSPLFKDNIATQDALIVQRIRRAGAHHHREDQCARVRTWVAHLQPRFRPLPQPVRPDQERRRQQRRRGRGVASGMLPVADGSDMGGSLRNPGNFNNVVGFRVSPGSGSLLAELQAVARPWREGTDGPHRRRLRVFALGAGGTRSPRPARLSGRSHASSATARTRLHGRQGRLVSRSRRTAARSARARHARGAARDLRSTRLHGGRCRSRSFRRGGMLSTAARGVLAEDERGLLDAIPPARSNPKRSGISNRANG